MKIIILTLIAMAAALLYVPQRARNQELSYTWVFRVTETLDVSLILLEFAVISILAAIAFTFVKARRK
jgi:hypothetical protein